MKRDVLKQAAEQFGTPCYVYDLDAIVQRVHLLRTLFDNEFQISYAIKANPNAALMNALNPVIDTFDASSFAEVKRALAAGMPAGRVSFSGPAKRPTEITGAVDAGLGELVIETLQEARTASDHARSLGRRQPCLVRLNPLKVPRKFGASMAGTPSQFGIDEEDMETVLPHIAKLDGLELIGFHIYSGTNCLDAEAIADNFGIFIDIFRKAQDITGIRPSLLIFGSGFGVPYLQDEKELDHDRLRELVLPLVADLRKDPIFAETRLTLELGRWLVAPFGWLLTRVISAKTSRGSEFRACDAGFNNHLAACGMMGSVFRRNWRYINLSNPDGIPALYTLVGPLCTTIDRLAVDVDLAEVRVDDLLAIPQSGAYGLTASPTRFISHPDPREIVLRQGKATDVSEALLNHWA
ncbi:type III PLP-dependent enzyme [uncultured Roseobacter sp.]|uniref:type III PLP-dependent enzyme n=1 Tax=uncultured Roseobacter sp. TaxID=114847 RepID=UPI00262885C6|nr:type III PLP-dependent enzyme [uncultured Roseobacter sp.]